MLCKRMYLRVYLNSKNDMQRTTLIVLITECCILRCKIYIIIIIIKWKQLFQTILSNKLYIFSSLYVLSTLTG